MLLLLNCLEMVAMAIGSDIRVNLKGYRRIHAYVYLCRLYLPRRSYLPCLGFI